MFKKVFTVLSLLLLPALVLQGCEGSAMKDPKQMAFIMNSIWFLTLGVVVYYFFLIRPTVQKDQEQKQFLDTLKKGMEVRTTGGIIGRVAEIRPDEILLEVSRDVKIRVDANHVSPIVKNIPKTEIDKS
jgi:preprotein translocase subunit YajC